MFGEGAGVDFSMLNCGNVVSISACGCELHEITIMLFTKNAEKIIDFSFISIFLIGLNIGLKAGNESIDHYEK